MKEDTRRARRTRLGNKSLRVDWVYRYLNVCVPVDVCVCALRQHVSAVRLTTGKPTPFLSQEQNDVLWVHPRALLEQSRRRLHTLLHLFILVWFFSKFHGQQIFFKAFFFLVSNREYRRFSFPAGILLFHSTLVSN